MDENDSFVNWVITFNNKDEAIDKWKVIKNYIAIYKIVLLICDNIHSIRIDPLNWDGSMKGMSLLFDYLILIFYDMYKREDKKHVA